MARFDPQPHDKVTWDASSYEVMPHPAVPMFAFGQMGRKGVVYQLKNSRDELFAFKIFKRAFQDKALVDICAALSQLSGPGLEACQRECLTNQSAEALIKRYPEMEYAILMPWVKGSTWYDIVYAKSELDLNASKELAKNMAFLLARLEEEGLAHCDISGGNVIVNTNNGSVHLIDVEDMFGLKLPSPTGFPQGTDGYQHRTSRTAAQGQWCVEGDRFSAAILLAEILAWHKPQIRQASDQEHYFAEDELQDESSTRYHLMVEVLAGVSHEIADCFVSAWRSPSLADCPPLSKWAEYLSFSTASKWRAVPAPPLPAPYQPDFEPIEIEPEPSYKPNFSDISTLIALAEPEPVAPKAALARPTLYELEAVAVNEAYTITWSPVPDAERYELQVESDIFAQRGIYQTSHQVATNSFESSQHDAGTYSYRVRALNRDQTSEWSKQEAIEIIAEIKIVAPAPKVEAAPAVEDIEIKIVSSTALQDAQRKRSKVPVAKQALKAPTLHQLEPVLVNEPYTVSWSEVPEAEEYHLGIATSSILAQSGLCQVIGQSADTMIISSQDQAGTYYYRVKAVKGSQESEWSHIQAIQVSTPQVSTPKPVTPKSVGPQPGGTGQPPKAVAQPTTPLERPKLDPVGALWVSQPYDLKWSPVTGATEYGLQIAESYILSQSGVFDPIGSTPNTTYTINHDSPRTVYYRVRALNNRQESQWSEAEAAIVKPTVKLKVPILRVVQAYSDASVKIGWSAVSGAEWYELQEAKINKLTQYSPVYPYRDVSLGHSIQIKDTEITLSSREPGIYAYRVRACNVHGCGNYSKEKRVEVKKPLPLALPEAPRLHPIKNPDKNNSYTIRWEYVNGAAGYVLYEARKPDFSDQKEAYYGLSSSKYLEDKEPGLYYYRVFAYNKQGKYDRNKPSRRVSTEVVLKAPEWQRAYLYPKNQQTGLKLSWAYVKGAKKYEVMAVNLAQFIESHQHNFKMRPVSEGTYKFRVRAIRSGGTVGEWSDMIVVEIDRDLSNQLSCKWSVKK